MRKNKLKKLFSITLTLSMIATLFIGMAGTAHAVGEEFPVDGIKYMCQGGEGSNIPPEVEVLGTTLDSGSVNIPSGQTIVHGSHSHIATSISANAFYLKAINSVTIPASIQSIGNRAFSSCSSLTTVNLPTTDSQLTTIGDEVFVGCGFSSITIPSSVTDFGYGVFHDNGSLTTVNLPMGLTALQDATFMNCTSLQSIKLPTSLTTLGSSGTQGVFESCAGLTTITWPTALQTIKPRVFKDCTSLQTVTIPDSVTNVGAGAFKGCTSLQSITLPASLTTLGSPTGSMMKVFDECVGLQTVKFNAQPTNIEENVFSGSGAGPSSPITLIVPSTWDWSQFDPKDANNPSTSVDPTTGVTFYLWGGYFKLGSSSPTPSSHGTNGNPVKINTIKTGDGIHGTYKVDKPFTVNGEDVKIIATPDEGYEIDKIYVDGKEVKSLEIKNVTEDTKVEVTFKKIDEKKDEQKDEPKDEKQTEIQKVQKQVSKAQFIARSKVSTLKNGKSAIKVTWSDSANVNVKFDGYEVYRSTDREKGYGTKPIFKTKNKYYYNTKIEAGQKYYYKVKAYKVVDGKKVYTDYSLKAWREI